MLFSGQFQPRNQTIVITGASQGLGRQFAKTLYELNNNVIIVSRSASKLSDAITYITGASSTDPELKNDSTLPEEPWVKYIAADLSKYDACDEIFKVLAHHKLTPNVYMQCAGQAVPKLFADLSQKELEMGVTTNYQTALYFSHGVAKYIKETGVPSHIILVSSVVAFFSFIGYAQYAPLKAALRALADILKQEMRPYNTRVSCIFPGNFASEGFEEEERTKPEVTRIIEGPSYPVSCQQCVDTCMWWLDRGYDDVLTDAIGWLLMSSNLGFGGRIGGILQGLFGAILGVLLIPIYRFILRYQIDSYFKSNKKN